jgi:vitamin B12 transporter
VSFTDSVVVTASLGEETPSDLPAAVSVVSAEELAARQTTEIFSVLGTLPGLATTQLGSPGKAASVFTRGANSNQTLVLWNGIPLNDPYFGGFDWSNLPAEGVERVEVVRGPFSALWGSDAMGGVVNVLTQRAPGSTLTVEGGGDNYRRAALSGALVREPFSVVATGHLRRGDGEVDNDFFDSDDGTLRATWTLAPGGDRRLAGPRRPFANRHSLRLLRRAVAATSPGQPRSRSGFAGGVELVAAATRIAPLVRAHRP